ncbi:MAG: hypothetical protein IKP21_08690 [Bacteroidales bacterium]|nr:hypothetical protein [Bacteroidales bacterium]
MLVVAAVVASLSATLCGCNKDDSGLLEVFAESFGSDTKLVVNNRIASWQDGDEICINGTTAAIRRQLSQGDTHAYIPSTAASAVNRAVFPASLCSSITGDNITIALPSEYRYRTAGGLQVLEVPMAAASAEESPLHFRHLTGALNIRIRGRNEPVILESVTISSDKYQLSGSWPLNFADIAGQTAHEATSDEQKSVSLKFDGTELPANDSLDVIIPVPSVDSDNHFTVTVKARHEGIRFVYTRSQTGDADRSLDRNVMGYAEATLDSASKRTLFAGKGSENDYYQISSKEDFVLMVEAINSKWVNVYERNYSQSYYRLTDSIDMLNTVISPITNLNTVFDGGGYAVKNLTITSINTQGSTYQCGLFASPYATIKNLTLDNVKLQHSGDVTTLLLSPLCAKAASCTISNCTIRNVKVIYSGNSTYTRYGAIVASTSANVNVTKCNVEGSLTGLDVPGLYYGGLFGEIEPSAIVNITNCSVVNDTLIIGSTGLWYFGGIVGSVSNSAVYIDSSYWYGKYSISSNGFHAGGGVGYYIPPVSGSGSLSILNSNFNGSFVTNISNGSLYIGRYIGRRSRNRSVDFTGSTANITLNGSVVTVDIGKQ